MHKRLLSILLCLVFLLGMAVPVFADEADAQEEVTEQPPMTQIKLTSVEEFLSFAESCRLDSYSRYLEVSLEADIDLSGTEFESIPIFSGVFLGNGHTISGLDIAAEGSVAGLFRYLTATASVQELTVRGRIHPGGSRGYVGGIAGSNAGSITNCSFDGTISGSDNVGGIAGINTVTGIIESCRVTGDIHGNHFVGGIAGDSSGVIRNCQNHAEINTTAVQNSVEISDITIESLTNSESANTVTDIGGIAGTSRGVIRGCENRGNVGYRHMGYNIGGIAGTQSGYIVDCRNFGDIQGRKEIGGIVGQMEPVSLIEFTQDTLQILREQLDTMSGLVNQASGNAQSNASQITGQIGVLQDQTQTAKDAVTTLFPSADNPQLPDADTLLAAQNTLSSTLQAMPRTLTSIASATQATVSGLIRDLQAVSAQIGAMGQTISGASENLGGSLTDVSDQDTSETLTGKVEACVNYGSVLADLNAGGIAGAMAMENDLDSFEDWEQSGEESLNFAGEVRAVVLACQNHGTVTGKKQNAGGIVGWQSMGLVKSSENTGTLDAAAADYVGGIAGLSTGFIRSSHAKCSIEGASFVGGIAGSGTIATDCRSMVLITGGTEKAGAILGQAGENETEEEPISGNFYLNVSADIGAIDGISYSGKAEPLGLEEFLALEELPELFETVTVRFVFADGTEAQVSVPLNGSLDAASIPAIPEKDGYMAQWEDLAEENLSNILFNMTFEAVYTAHNTTLQSAETRDSGLPILLVQGTFTHKAGVSVAESESAPALSEGETLLESWEVTVTEADGLTAARLLLPDGMDAESVSVLVRGADGQWQTAGHAANGSYITFPWSTENSAVALVAVERQSLLLPAAAVCFALISAAALLLRRKKRRKPHEEPTEA